MSWGYLPDVGVSGGNPKPKGRRTMGMFSGLKVESRDALAFERAMSSSSTSSDTLVARIKSETIPAYHEASANARSM